MKPRIKHATEWIRFSDLSVEPIYQRDVVWARISYLAKNWRGSDIGIITVSFRDGKYWIVDGQHRYLAALELGLEDTKVLCHVHRDLTVEQEAKLFASLNDQRAPTAYDRFKAGLVYGDRIAIGVDKATRRHGFFVSSSSARGKISCVAKLMELERRDPELLDATLQVVSSAWGNERAAVEAPILAGVAKVLDRYNGSVDLTDLAIKLKKNSDPGSLLGHAKGIKAMSGKPAPETIALSVVDIYNKGKRSKALKTP